MGPEPILGYGYTQEQMIIALNWYNYMFEVTDGIDWLVEYMSLPNSKFTKSQVSRIKGANPKKISFTVMALARIAIVGTALTQRQEDKITNEVNRVLKVVPQEPSVIYVPTVKERIQEKVGNIIADLDEKIDQFTNSGYLPATFDFFSYFKEQDLKSGQAIQVATYFQRILEEISSNFKEEGYIHLTKKQHQNYVILLQNIIKSSELINTNERAARKPRAVKTKLVVKTRVAKKVPSTFKYQKDNLEFKVTSVDPSRILGATQIWIYNTKYNHFSYYTSTEPMSIKGTSIVGYDEDNSFRVKPKKPAEVCQTIIGSGKVPLRHYTTELNKTKKYPLNGRSSTDVIILRVEK